MIVCFDLETTWLNKKTDEIIEIALVKFDETNFKVIDTYTTLVNPQIKIPELISNITHIFDDDVLWAPYLDEVKDKILEFIWDAPLLGHNVFFDRDFFVEKWIDISKNIVLDTFFLANFLCYREVSLNLEMLCKSFWIELDWAHRALNDVMATIGLFEKLVEKFRDLDTNSKEYLSYIFLLSDDVSVAFLSDYLFEYTQLIVHPETFKNNLLDTIDKNYKKLEELKLQSTNTDITVEWLLSKLPWLEVRENQKSMSDTILSNLSNKEKSIIEAPTWLWKSFAYLIPSIIHARNTGEKVYISTKTKNLQDQLYNNDLSYLSENLNINFSYTKLKGKNNYISIDSLFSEINLWDISYHKTCFLLKIVFWLLETEHGELDELNYYGQEYTFLKSLFPNISIDWKHKNIYKEYEFLYRARENVEIADIVIVNHSLLFSDVASDNSLLGDIKYLVLDEAHNIEDSVTDSVKRRFNIKQLEDTFTIIERILSQKLISKIDFVKLSDEVVRDISLLMDYAYNYLNTNIPVSNNYRVCLLKEDFYSGIDTWVLHMKIKDNIDKIISYLSTIEKYDFFREKSLLKEYLNDIISFLKADNLDTYIKIIQYNDNNGLTLEYTLLSPWSYLKKNLWNKLDSCILTSATLKVWGNFDYITRNLSLEDFSCLEFQTDFDYSRQATLFIPNDLWSIKNNATQIVQFLKEFYTTARGNILTLLTSFSMIRRIYTDLNMDLEEQGISLYAQSIWWSKAKLIHSFSEKSDNSILLGTDSFWEWVDIKWEKIKYLVIHKFPFPVPTDPIFLARSKLYNDPFGEYSVPKSIIKLKQGFGRLIRSKSDTGIVVLLDDRICTTSWWRSFYDAFPENINIKNVSSRSFIEVLQKL